MAIDGKVREVDTVQSVVRVAIPGASDGLCDHVVWGRTAFPAKGVTAQDMYRAASRLRRATDKGERLCDTCDRKAELGRWTCAHCSAALARGTEEAQLT